MSPLEQLEDIILPTAIGWWPLASTVWITLLVITGVATGLIWYFLRSKKQNIYRKEANFQLNELRNLESSEFLIELNKLLKQLAITTYGRQSSANLDGESWLKFLKAKAAFLEQPPALKKLENRYATDLELSQQEKNSLIYYTQHWIKGHHL